MAGSRMECMVGHRCVLARTWYQNRLIAMPGTLEGRLTAFAAVGGVMVRAEAFASLTSTARFC